MANFDNIIQEINTNLPDNTTQAITAAKLRTTLIDLTNQIDTVQDDFETNVQEQIDNFPVKTDNIVSDFDISDEQGYVIAKFENGHIRTKNFNSAEAVTEENLSYIIPVSVETFDDGDLSISDEQGYVIAKFENGHIRTKNFNSAEAVTEENFDDGDLSISDEQGYVITKFENGHIRTKNFNSANGGYSFVEKNLEYSERPSGGYENFLVTINDAIANNNDITMNLQDSVVLRQDRCMILLPTNYTATGTPTRLVVLSQGSYGHIESSSTTISTVMPALNGLLAEGYAVMAVNGTPGYLNGINQYGGLCTPGLLKSVKAAYEYVMKKYNLKKDGVLLGGWSQGSCEVWQMAANKVFPIKAMVVYGFVSSLWKMMYAHGNKNSTITTLDGRTVNPREWMCEQFGFVEKEANSYVLDIFSSIYNQGDIVTKPTTFSAVDVIPNDYELAYILNNYELWLGYDPISWGTSKQIFAEQFRYRSSVSQTNPDEDAVYDDVSNIVPCPVKIFAGMADTITPIKLSNWYKTMADNAGMPCEFRKYETGTHSFATQYPTISVDTKYGGTITVNIPTWEGILFLERYDY